MERRGCGFLPFFFSCFSCSDQRVGFCAPGDKALSVQAIADEGNRRIVDAGIFPILPSAHLSATMYAVAEKVSVVLDRGGEIGEAIRADAGQ